MSHLERITVYTNHLIPGRPGLDANIKDQSVGFFLDDEGHDIGLVITGSTGWVLLKNCPRVQSPFKSYP
jgi:hypothetical protein